MTDIDPGRRTFLRTSAVAATLTALTVATARAQSNTTSPLVRTPNITFKMQPLPFDPQKIQGMSERILVSHYENNYGGAVKRLNSITEHLATLDYDKAQGFLINGLKREELIATNSMILHELFFGNLGEPNAPGPDLAAAITHEFGSMERWRSEFVAMGKAQGGGSGWVILTYSPRDKRLINAWAADHTTTIAGGDPIMVLDMYEHAYQMDFGAKAADYVAAFMGALNWSNADRLYAHYSRS